MHIMDGILATPVLAAGSVVGLAGLAYGLRTMDSEQLPRAALLSAAFFVASLIHIPVGPVSVHLVLNGLVGLVLGWAAFPAIAVGLLLQMALFGFGGVTVFAVNLLCMAAPAVAVGLLFAPRVRVAGPRRAFAWGCLAGVSAIGLGALMVAGFLVLSGSSLEAAARLVVLAHVPVMITEGVLVGAAAKFLRQIKPSLFDGTPSHQVRHA